MKELPRISGRECVKAKELDRGTLRAIIRQANVSMNDFINTF